MMAPLLVPDPGDVPFVIPVVVATPDVDAVAEVANELLEKEDDDDEGSIPGRSKNPRLDDCVLVFVYTGGLECGFKRITN